MKDITVFLYSLENKQNRGQTCSKSAKAPKGTKGSKSTKAPKGTKESKSTKAPKGTKGSKALKATKAPKAKAPKSSKTAKPKKDKKNKKMRRLINSSCGSPHLLHPVIQWQGKCCFDTSSFKVFTPTDSSNQFSSTILLNRPDPNTCMKGITFDGSYDLDGTYHYQLAVKGKFLETSLVDYALSGTPGTKVRYGKVQGN